jgi:hypothetical protein
MLGKSMGEDDSTSPNAPLESALKLSSGHGRANLPGTFDIATADS